MKFEHTVFITKKGTKIFCKGEDDDKLIEVHIHTNKRFPFGTNSYRKKGKTKFITEHCLKCGRIVGKY